jgi:hypothetical protein
MTVEKMTKSVMSVAELARLCSLSRTRFYQLVDQGVFPPPVYNVASKRPFYTENMQMICMEVRRRNCGVNGQAVLFYAARHPIGQPPKMIRKPAPKPESKGRFTDVIEGLKALGLESVTSALVEQTVGHLFPNGVEKLPTGEVTRGVFLHLKRRNSSDNVGR